MLAVIARDAFAAIYKLVDAQKGNVDPDATMLLVKTLRLQSPRGDVAFDPVTRDIVQTMYIRRTEKRAGQIVNTEIAAYPNVNASHL